MHAAKSRRALTDMKCDHARIVDLSSTLWTLTMDILHTLKHCYFWAAQVVASCEKQFLKEDNRQ